MDLFENSNVLTILLVTVDLNVCSAVDWSVADGLVNTDPVQDLFQLNGLPATGRTASGLSVISLYNP